MEMLEMTSAHAQRQREDNFKGKKPAERGVERNKRVADTNETGKEGNETAN